MHNGRYAWFGLGALAATAGACQLVSGLSGYAESGGSSGTGAGGATTSSASSSSAVAAGGAMSSAESSAAESSSATATSTSSTCGGADQDAAPLCFRLLFVTSTPHVGKFPPVPGGSGANGLSGADEFCRSLADAPESAPLAKGRTWIAWLSWVEDGSGDAKSRLSFDAGGLKSAYRLVDGATEIFPVGFRFAGDAGPGMPAQAITMTEKGDVEPGKSVWTGTLADGTFASPAVCGGWNLGDPALGIGRLGDSGVASQWTSSSNLGNGMCTESHSLYCFEADSP